MVHGILSALLFFNITNDVNSAKTKNNNNNKRKNKITFGFAFCNFVKNYWREEGEKGNEIYCLVKMN